MKRALLILLAALFLSTSSGVSFYFHYCGKSLDGISLVGKSSCSCEDGNQTSDCCRDKVHHIKIKDRFVAGHRESRRRRHPPALHQVAGYPWAVDPGAV
jgi:hypothetical protein